MLTILLHSSKTMRPAETVAALYQRPALMEQAAAIAKNLKTLTPAQIETSMHVSATKARQTHKLLQSWTDEPALQRPAINAFLGDIYSGLQVQSFNKGDRNYANQHLIILSGLYGGLRALDCIHPYRLEMGYKLPNENFKNLYKFWGDAIAKLLPTDTTIINLSAVEYTKAVLPYSSHAVIAPKFMTISPKTGEPTFVTVHAKIARGAFAHWMIKQRIDLTDSLSQFDELGYVHAAAMSTPEQPVFVCQQFKGLGLSVRLS